MKTIEELKREVIRLEQANQEHREKTGKYSRTITTIEMNVRSKILKRERL